MPSFFDQYLNTAIPDSIIQPSTWFAIKSAAQREVARLEERTPLQRMYDSYSAYRIPGHRDVAVYKMMEFMRNNINKDNYSGFVRSCTAHTRYNRRVVGEALGERIGLAGAYAKINEVASQEAALVEAEAALVCARANSDVGVSRDLVDATVHALRKRGLLAHRCACCATAFFGDSNPVLDRDGQYYCDRCVGRGLVTQLNLSGSDEDGFWVSAADAYAYNETDEYGDIIDSAMVSASYVTQHRLRYDSISGAYYTPAAYEMRRRCSASNGAQLQIYDYHCGPMLGHIPSKFDKRKPTCLLGMELEVEVPEDGDDGDYPDTTTLAVQILKATQAHIKNYVKCEYDGSLDRGFEMITGYTGLDVHKEMLDVMASTDAWRDLRSHDTSTCGLHVHLDRKDMTPLHVMKLQAFVNSACNQPLFQCVGRRYNTSYARFHTNHNWTAETTRAFMERIKNQASRRGITIQQALKSPQTDAADVVRLIQDQRYSALNWQPEYTVEFRMFRGTTRVSTIMACLELAYACWQFARVAKLNELDIAHFMQFITAPSNRCDTKHLRAFLHAKRFAPLFQQEQIVRPKDKRFTLVEPTTYPSENDAHVLSPEELREHAMNVWPREAARREEVRERNARNRHVAGAGGPAHLHPFVTGASGTANQGVWYSAGTTSRN